MKNPKKTPNDETRNEDRETTEAIRRQRKFDLSEAVAREAAGSLKGASPVPGARQVLAGIEQILEAHLDDPDGSLLRTLLARLELNLPLLADHFDDPAGALLKMLEEILSTESSLAELVRQTDARWGREYQERPHFNLPGRPDHPADPYTPASVRQALERLLAAL
jgi:hypothetical protein